MNIHLLAVISEDFTKTYISVPKLVKCSKQTEFSAPSCTPATVYLYVLEWTDTNSKKKKKIRKASDNERQLVWIK